MSYVMRQGRRIEVETLPSDVAPRKKRQPANPFVQVPLWWVDRLRAAHRKSTYRVSLYLLYERWKVGGGPICLSNVAIAGAGVSSKEKWRALHELERFGLIKVERRSGRSPVIIVFADQPRTSR
jgi:hypothetical protein